MKYWFFLISFSLFFTFARSQDFITMVAEEACDCITQAGFEGKDYEEIEMLMGGCILKSVVAHNEEFEKYTGGQKLMEIDQEAFGEEVGMYMSFICPDLFVYINQNWGEEEPLEVEFGKIISIESKQFNIINLETGDGSILKFLWLWDFEGRSELQQGEFKDKWVNIIYSPVPLYEPTKGEYINYRVIEGIMLGE